MKIDYCFDLAEIRRLLDSCKAEIGESALTDAQCAALGAAVACGEIVFFVAKNDAAPVAICSVSRTFSTYTCSRGGVFEDFFVMPEYRKSGLARRLAEHAFDYCRKNGVDTLWVGCADCDREMYKGLGFGVELGNLLSWPQNQ